MTIEAKIDETNSLLKQLIAALAGKPPVAAAKPPAKAPEKDGTITYENVKVAFLDLVKSKNRDAGVAVLAKFKAKTLPDVKPEQFKAVLEAIAEAAKAAPANADALV